MEHSRSYFAARRQLIEGPGDADSGAWPTSWYRILKGWGTLPLAYWPDQEDVKGTVVPNEPPNADAIAKQDRIAHYQRLQSELECVYAASTSRSLTVALEINKAWRNPPGGRIEFDPDLPVRSVHSIQIGLFDFEIDCFVFPNTWGPKWGLNGLGFLPFGYLTRFITDAWSASPQTLGSSQKPGIYTHQYVADKSRLGMPLVIDIWDGDNDVIAAWGHAVKKRKSIDVEEVFVRPEYRRRGFGTKIVEAFKQAAAESEPRVPLRFWVPWGDHTDLNSKNLISWARKQELKLEPSGCRFAAFIGKAGKPVRSLPRLNWSPTKATSPLHLLDDEQEQIADDDTMTAVVERPQEIALDKPRWNKKLEAMRSKLIEKEYRGKLTKPELKKLNKLQELFGRYQDFISPLPMEDNDGQ